MEMKETQETKPYDPQEAIANLIENEEPYGKLKYISKRRKEGECRTCGYHIQIGEDCFSQSDHTGTGIFPFPTLVCISCGKKQIEEGMEVKNPDLYNKKILGMDK